MNKPTVVRVATWLLWISVAVDLVSALVAFAGQSSRPAVLWIGVGFSLAFVALAAVITWFYSAGRRWARAGVAVFLAIDSLGLLSVAFPETRGAVTIIPAVFDVVALAFATWAGFSKAGSGWFVATPDSAAMRAILPVGRSGWAIAAGYLALFSVLILPAPFALACGIMAIRDMRRHPEKHGMGRAIFGIVMGTLGILAIAVAFWMRSHR